MEYYECNRSFHLKGCVTQCLKCQELLANSEHCGVHQGSNTLMSLIFFMLMVQSVLYHGQTWKQGCCSPQLYENMTVLVSPGHTSREQQMLDWYCGVRTGNQQLAQSEQSLSLPEDKFLMCSTVFGLLVLCWCLSDHNDWWGEWWKHTSICCGSSALLLLGPVGI